MSTFFSFLFCTSKEIALSHTTDVYKYIANNVDNNQPQRKKSSLLWGLNPGQSSPSRTYALYASVAITRLPKRLGLVISQITRCSQLWGPHYIKDIKVLTSLSFLYSNFYSLVVCSGGAPEGVLVSSPACECHGVIYLTSGRTQDTWECQLIKLLVWLHVCSVLVCKDIARGDHSASGIFSSRRLSSLKQPVSSSFVYVSFPSALLLRFCFSFWLPRNRATAIWSCSLRHLMDWMYLL